DELDKFMCMRGNYMRVRRMRESQQRLVIGNISYSVDRPIVKFTPASASRDRRAAAYARQLMEQQPQEVDWPTMDHSDHMQYAQVEQEQHPLPAQQLMEWEKLMGAAEPLKDEPVAEPTTVETQVVEPIEDDYEALTRAAREFLSRPLLKGQCSQVPKEEPTCDSITVQPGAEAAATVNTVEPAITEPARMTDSLIAKDEESCMTGSPAISNTAEPSEHQKTEASTVTECAKDLVCAQGKKEREQTIAMLIDEIKKMEKVKKGKGSPSQKDPAEGSAPIEESPVEVDEQQIDNNDEAVLEESRAERMKLYETGSAFKKFPQLEKNTNMLLGDLAATLDKSLADLVSSNDKLWDSLGKIKDHLKKEDVKACEDAGNGDLDFLNLLYLIAFLNGSRRNAKIDRVSRLYTTMHYSSPALALAALGDSKLNQPLAFKCSNSSALYLSLDGRAIPVEKGGVRLAVLSVVAGTHLLNLAIDQQVGDVVRFFYSAAGLQLLRKPVAVAKARDIIGV
ncbi:hypothetical protein PRIPAC_88579, partial [Pristionchus pacificus]